MNEIIKTKLDPADPRSMQGWRAQQEARDEQRLPQLSQAAALQKEREALAEREAEIAQIERQHLRKLDRIESLNKKRQAIEANIARAKYYLAQATSIEADLTPTITNFFFEGLHPRWGDQAAPNILFETASKIAGIRLVRETFPPWLKAQEAAIEDAAEEMFRLAKELQILDQMPIDIQKRAKAKAE